MAANDGFPSLALDGIEDIGKPISMPFDLGAVSVGYSLPFDLGDALASVGVSLPFDILGGALAGAGVSMPFDLGTLVSVGISMPFDILDAGTSTTLPPTDLGDGDIVAADARPTPGWWSDTIDAYEDLGTIVTD